MISERTDNWKNGYLNSFSNGNQLLVNPSTYTHQEEGISYKFSWPGRVSQSVTCLVTDASLTADPGVASSIPARSHTFVEIDHEIISMVVLLPSAESFKKGCCQLQAKVCARSTG